MPGSIVEGRQGSIGREEVRLENKVTGQDPRKAPETLVRHRCRARDGARWRHEVVRVSKAIGFRIRAWGLVRHGTDLLILALRRTRSRRRRRLPSDSAFLVLQPRLQA